MRWSGGTGLIEQDLASLQAEAGRIRPAPESLEAGTMLEVPSLLFQLPCLLAEADLYMAVDGYPRLSDLRPDMLHRVAC